MLRFCQPERLLEEAIFELWLGGADLAGGVSVWRGGYSKHSLLPSSRQSLKHKELQGKKCQRLHSFGCRELSSVWPCRCAKMFGLLPKWMDSHWIVLNRKTMCFRKVILVFTIGEWGRGSQASGGLQRLLLAIYVWYDAGLPKEMDRSGQLWEDQQWGER